MEKANRKRDRAITVRMTDEEYTLFKNKADSSGLSRQAFFIRLIKSARVNSSDELVELRKINEVVSDLDRQVRGLATNVNQMARIANGTGAVHTEKKLAEIFAEICRFRKEISDIWQSIRSSIQAG